MKSQSLFVVILVTLGHSSAILRQPRACNRTDDGAVDTSELETLKQKALSLKYASHNPFFYGLEALAAQRIFNLEPVSSIENSTISLQQTQEDKDGADLVLAAISIALRKHCDGIKTAEDRIHAYIDDGIVAARPAVELALAGNYPANRATIETAQARVQRDILAWVQTTYGLLRTCLDSTDADILAAIRTAENGSAVGLLRVGNADFNAIKKLAIAITNGSRSPSVISDIEASRFEALAEFREEVNHVFGILEALLLKSCGESTAGIVSDLSANRYAAIMSSSNADESAATVFSEIFFQASRIVFGYSDDDNAKFPARIDALRFKTATILVADGDYFFDSYLATRPNDLRTVENARKELRGLIDQIVPNYFKMIQAAQDRSETYRKIIPYLDSLTEKMYEKSIVYADVFFSLMTKGRTLDKQVEAEFSVIKKKCYRAIYFYFQHFKEGTVILTKITHTNKTASTDDISAIRTAESNSIRSVRAYAVTVLDAFRLVLLAST